jgi:hypothetical protein
LPRQKEISRFFMKNKKFNKPIQNTRILHVEYDVIFPFVGKK